MAPKLSPTLGPAMTLEMIFSLMAVHRRLPGTRWVPLANPAALWVFYDKIGNMMDLICSHFLAK